MIDTVRLASPPMQHETVQAIEQRLVRRSAVDLATGELQYEFTSGGLLGSWDSRVSIQIEREEWVYLRPTVKSGSRGVTIKQACAPYIVVEGSVHKAMLGHNVFGGPCDWLAAMAWFVAELGERLGVELPAYEAWRVLRVDWAEAFDLGSFEAVQEFVSGLNAAEFPRRTVVRYGAESCFAPGRTTTVKAYHKGPEFSVHDWKRLVGHVDRPELISLQERANGILRLETSIKAKKLTDDFQGEKPSIVQVTQSYLERVHDREVARLLKEGAGEMATVRTHKEVSRRLHETYERQLANTLLGTWLQLAALGETEVRRSLARATFYRQRKQLSDAGCAWLTTDVMIRTHSAVPDGFAPVRMDPRRLLDEAYEVQSMMRPFAKV